MVVCYQSGTPEAIAAAVADFFPGFIRIVATVVAQHQQQLAVSQLPFAVSQLQVAVVVVKVCLLAFTLEGQAADAPLQHQAAAKLQHQLAVLLQHQLAAQLQHQLAAQLQHQLAAQHLAVVVLQLQAAVARLQFRPAVAQLQLQAAVARLQYRAVADAVPLFRQLLLARVVQAADRPLLIAVR